jgi:tripartite-type tricarboxylate transporter receptor subunit TctC
MMKQLALAALASLMPLTNADAQTYPDHPITIVVPVSAGGPTDAIARTLAERMRISLGHGGSRKSRCRQGHSRCT